MLCASVLSLAVFTSSALAKDWDSPVYNYLYQYPLPFPTVKSPLYTYNNPANGKSIDYFEVVIKPLESQVYPNLGVTKLVGYDGESPGPTFNMTRGREAVVRYINQGTQASAIHLHGSYSRAPFDGWAEDTIPVGSYKDYYYPNAQAARTLWYHDHAIDHTAHNAYFGQAGFYIMHDEEELAVPGLPQGKYDVPLALSSKRYNADGTLWDPDTNGETQSLWGDVIHVNGQPWPFFNVEPRKYRFRFLDAAVSRSFILRFESETGTRLNFNVVGSDAGLALKPELVSDLSISMGERYEVVVDFAAYKGQNVTLRNARNVQADVDYLHTDKVMRFVVGQTVTDTSKNDDLPSILRSVEFPVNKNAVDRNFKFGRSGSGGWTVNGITWEDGAEARVLAKPQRGATEIWTLENSSGGWSHPIHIHLVDFQIISRTGGDRTAVLAQERNVLKDVIWLGRNEVIKVIARYAPWDGLYMFHCHNLIHEDHAMMASFNVSALNDLGYTEKTRFLDPMDPTYMAKPYDRALSQESEVLSKLAFFGKLEAYDNVDTIDNKLKSYWLTKTVTTAPLPTSSGVDFFKDLENHDDQDDYYEEEMKERVV
ncbi:Iron transport multicopper oxidase [Sphaceloma murrayae]|uniref:Iron transport multicopper oxidase n=1 Tax=Sphaceloma murrayae TaxID=2082308 RepID=A0A2K1QGX3_9PEZI|nr:Iron transport multicopper oxidase [Sphaceloma murrayae]